MAKAVEAEQPQTARTRWRSALVKAAETPWELPQWVAPPKVQPAQRRKALYTPRSRGHEAATAAEEDRMQRRPSADTMAAIEVRQMRVNELWVQRNALTPDDRLKPRGAAAVANEAKEMISKNGLRAAIAATAAGEASLAMCDDDLELQQELLTNIERQRWAFAESRLSAYLKHDARVPATKPVSSTPRKQFRRWGNTGDAVLQNLLNRVCTPDLELGGLSTMEEQEICTRLVAMRVLLEIRERHQPPALLPRRPISPRSLSPRRPISAR